MSFHQLSFTRMLDAPVSLVWSAFTDPEQLVKFFGPAGTSVPLASVELDVRPGGTFRLVMAGDDGVDFPMDSHFIEVIHQEKLSWEGPVPGSVVTVTLTAVDAKTQAEWAFVGEAPDELARNASLGFNSALDQLVEHIANVAA